MLGRAAAFTEKGNNMWLDDLNELVGRLKKRIEQHNEVLRGNETATRYALIDPLLTALGWDLSDPGQVQTEYKPDGGPKRSDYAMFTGEDEKKPRFVIEAKHLGKQINDEVIDQALNYCTREGIRHFVVTNGSHWEIYKTSGDTHIKERRIVYFKLEDPTQTTVMNMLTLWRGNFESESPIVPVSPERPALQQAANPATQPVPAGSPSSVQRPNRGIPLGEFSPNKKDDPPAALLFSDGTEKSIAHWYEVQILVVEWLIKTGYLKKADCPVKGRRGGYLVSASRSPVHRNNKPFKAKKQVNGVWIEAAKDGPNHVRATKSILKARNVLFSHVRVVTET